MPKFILLIRENLNNYPMAEDKLQAIISAHSDWARALAAKGVFVDGYGIAPEGKLLSAKNNQVEVGEIKDRETGIGGLYILELNSLEEAIEIAKQCPTYDAGDMIEVRPLM